MSGGSVGRPPSLLREILPSSRRRNQIAGCRCLSSLPWRMFEHSACGPAWRESRARLAASALTASPTMGVDDVAELVAAQRFCTSDDRNGSWSCENAEVGSLTGLDCSATKLCEACAQYFSDFACNATYAAPRIVSARGPAKQAKVKRVLRET